MVAIFISVWQAAALSSNVASIPQPQKQQRTKDGIVMHPKGNPQSPSSALRPGRHEHEVEEDEDMAVLLKPEHRSDEHETPKCELQKHPSTRETRMMTWLIVCVLASIAAVVSLAQVAFPLSSRETFKQETGVVVPVEIQTLGWLGAMEEFREELIDLVVQMKKEEKAMDLPVQSTMVDVAPVFDLIDKAIDTFGVRTVFSHLFDYLEWYYPKKWNHRRRLKKKKKKKHSRSCDSHGVGCDWKDAWWLWHYVGAASAEKLLREGSLLLDSQTGERLDTAVHVMGEFFRIQERPHASRTSFHIEHGFIWHYLSATLPDLDTYPKQLASDLCGPYESKKRFVHSAHKYIGYECYHGVGHGVFMALATRQTGGNLNAKTMFRPKGNFVLNNETFCEAYRICESAPNASTTPEKACKSGIKHSYWVFNAEMSKSHDRNKSEENFRVLEKQACHHKAIHTSN